MFSSAGSQAGSAAVVFVVDGCAVLTLNCRFVTSHSASRDANCIVSVSTATKTPQNSPANLCDSCSVNSKIFSNSSSWINGCLHVLMTDLVNWVWNLKHEFHVTACLSLSFPPRSQSVLSIPAALCSHKWLISGHEEKQAR